VNFQQLRPVREAVRRGYNLADVAAALYTSRAETIPVQGAYQGLDPDKASREK
jgi:hypothetical protein